MFSVPFTQFLLPFGERKQVSLDIQDDSLKDKVSLILEHGCRFTCEILTTGQVSLCIEYPDIGDFDCRITTNDLSVPQKAIAMIQEFNLADFLDWKSEMENQP